MDKQHCEGCRDDFYNGNNDLGVSRCWMLESAKLIKRKPPSTEVSRSGQPNIGYWAGYYDQETMRRVNRLFRATHPVFGNETPTAEEAFEMGCRLMEARRHE